MDPVLSLAIWNGCFAASVIIARMIPGVTIRWIWLLGAFAVFNLNVALVLDFFDLNQHVNNAIGGDDLSFNWAGKIIALAASISIFLIGPFRRQDVGLTLQQSKGAILGWSVLLAICFLGVAVGIALPDEPHSRETILYQLTMPSLEEELAYRGLLLAILLRAIEMKAGGGRLRVLLAASVSTIVFTVIHALFWTNDGLLFSLEAFLFAAIFGSLLTWLRINTGSLLAPVILHSAVNTIWRLF